jgi:hypothetical protein
MHDAEVWFSMFLKLSRAAVVRRSVSAAIPDALIDTGKAPDYVPVRE